MTKIMIVDDEEDLREMIDILFHREGFETATAENGADFLQKIDDFKPDLVTLDIMMPGLTTREIFAKLKEKKTNPKIILLTVIRYSKEEKKKIFEMGNVVDYITKPFELNELVDAVHKQIMRQ
jgi:two-component system alkaline phosphatase synthesis response regulator PhoP